MKRDQAHPFEKGLERLEEISARLDDDAIPLEEAISLYEEGVKLSASLTEYLGKAERRILVAPQRDAEPLTIDECQPLGTEQTVTKKSVRSKKTVSREEDSLF
ncbi:MAG TPA: exodeoxyribonuclease VII small subunit [Spirochaetota bacterium]|nr:exodeoxyribonuclease VII small subunit [Spirochaetota bacterium]HPH02690.1 exodeoxyribonuclease VII small subunit [Spirochaetota bacterium]HPN81917.1 exodeoxyribonuclease VII small subunit [Spirochaetota bacterium]